MSARVPFSELSALQRARALLDADSFAPSTDVEATAAVVLGEGTLDGTPVLAAFIDGRVRGGTIGMHEAGILARIDQSAADGDKRPLIIGFDTGGVRVEEGPRALAAASAVGVALARLTLLGVPVAGVISGPRGCFGALAVMAALPDYVIITDNANWGLTGPKLLGDIHATSAAAVHLATSAATRLANGDAQAVVRDDAAAIRASLKCFLRGVPETATLQARVARSARVCAELRDRFRAQRPAAALAPPPKRGHQRDLLRYSFRGQWHPGEIMQRAGLVHAALGTLGTHPALGLIVGPEEVSDGGVGIEEAALVTDMLRRAVELGAEPAVVLTFLFCQGHAVDHTQERFGLHRALAECLRAMVGVRMLGHVLVSVLGGGTYGAAYLSLAAPSHRILAMRGTSVAPMAPQVLRAFQALRGHKAGHEAGAQLAELIPDIRIVESVIRLPRILREELAKLLEAARPDADAA